METFKKTLPKCQGGNTDAGYLFWIMSDDREIPKTAVYGCYDKQARQNQYVGRTYVKGNLIPGKVVPKEERIYTTWNGREITRKNYEMLTTKWNHNGLMWIACANGKFNSKAVQGGQTRSGEPIYIARALSPGWNMTVGKFLLSKGACFIPWKGKEIQCDQYELLCHRRKYRDDSYIYSPSRPFLQNS